MGKKFERPVTHTGPPQDESLVHSSLYQFKTRVTKVGGRITVPNTIRSKRSQVKNGIINKKQNKTQAHTGY